MNKVQCSTLAESSTPFACLRVSLAFLLRKLSRESLKDFSWIRFAVWFFGSLFLDFDQSKVHFCVEGYRKLGPLRLRLRYQIYRRWLYLSQWWRRNLYGILDYANSLYFFRNRFMLSMYARVSIARPPCVVMLPLFVRVLNLCWKKKKKFPSKT